MFPEHQQLIDELRQSDHHFDRLLSKHQALDRQVVELESHLEPDAETRLEQLKKEKLLLKDQIYDRLRRSV